LARYLAAAAPFSQRRHSFLCSSQARSAWGLAWGGKEFPATVAGKKLSVFKILQTSNLQKALYGTEFANCENVRL
jgi:hypothetical protein